MKKIKGFGLIGVLVVLIVLSVIGSSLLYNSNIVWWSNLLLNFAAGLFVSVLILAILSIRRFKQRRKTGALSDYIGCINAYDNALVIGFSRFRDAKKDNSAYWMHSWFSYFFEKYESFLNLWQNGLKDNAYKKRVKIDIIKQYSDDKDKINEVFSEAVRQTNENGEIDAETILKMEEYIQKYYIEHSSHINDRLDLELKLAREEERFDPLEE